MLGTTEQVTITRPTRDSQGRQTGQTSTLGTLRVRIQPLRLEDAIDAVGRERLATMVAPIAPTLQRDDRLTWAARTWRVVQQSQVTGRSPYQRCILSSPEQ
jgi:hypothetical protein